ncbi:MAG: ornithine--oxo-acid transaminase, partial [Candidatus Yanofskybacteria bacterium RIFCSPLOWO2_12_FULL_41_8]
MEENYSKTDLVWLSKFYLAPNYNSYPVIVDWASGCKVWDVEGKEYIDMLSGYSALNFGHVHPKITRALLYQADKVAVCPRKFLSEELIFFAKELAEFCGMEMVLPSNGGAEAVETAIKLARKWAYTKKGVSKNRAKIITCENNFHGRTVTIVSFSSEPQYIDLFGPRTPGFKKIPFGDAGALRGAITSDTAAFLVEPIQGEGGIVIPPDGYLKECREICYENNVLLIVDEIQTGFGRTGKMFACDHENVKPDLYILGKALGGGVLPVSAVVGSRELLSVFVPGDHGSTFGGNPLACHVAREALNVLREERLAERVLETGEYFLRHLRKIKSPSIKEVRGRGLLIGIEVKFGGLDAHEYCKRLIEEGVLCSDTKRYVIRIAPPLIINKAEIDWALERI